MSMKKQRAVQRDMDMTSGVIWKQLVMFALPLMIGNLFQQFYNTVDSVVVGNFVGKEALAAVGSVGPVINSVIGFLSGMATGASVVISQAYGAKNDSKVSYAVHTTICLTAICCVIFTAIAILITPVLLRFMNTPDDVFPQAEEYLTIYFAGLTGVLFYNIGAGILRAVGDSRHPLYFLIFCTCTNVVLDVLFVAVFNLGIAGAAFATVVAQLLSAFLVVRMLMRTQASYQLKLKKLKIDMGILKEIVRVGLPAGIQQMITSISNVFVQSYINAFGSDAMAGWSAYSKIDAFIMLPMQSIALSATTFVGQNHGAKKVKREKQGTWSAIALSMIITVVIMIPIMIFAPAMVRLFNSESAVIYYGAMLLRVMSPFYLFNCFNQVCAGALRGLGDSRGPMVIMLSTFVVFRQIYLYIASRLSTHFLVVAIGYPMGWIMCCIVMAIYYFTRTSRYFDSEEAA